MEKKPLIHAERKAQTKQTFRKKDRMLRPEEFDRVFKSAKLKLESEHCVLIAEKNEGIGTRLGLVVAKKKIRLATQRNSFRRYIREAFRKEKESIKNMDIVVLARTNKKKINKKKMHKEVSNLLKEIKDKND